MEIPWCVALPWWEGWLLRCSIHFLCEDVCLSWHFKVKFCIGLCYIEWSNKDPNPSVRGYKNGPICLCVCVCVCLSVCLGLWELCCALPQWCRTMSWTTDLYCAPPTCIVHHGVNRYLALAYGVTSSHHVTSWHDFTMSHDVMVRYQNVTLHGMTTING